LARQDPFPSLRSGPTAAGPRAPRAPRAPRLEPARRPALGASPSAARAPAGAKKEPGRPGTHNKTPSPTFWSRRSRAPQGLVTPLLLQRISRNRLAPSLARPCGGAKGRLQGDRKRGRARAPWRSVPSGVAEVMIPHRGRERVGTVSASASGQVVASPCILHLQATRTR